MVLKNITPTFAQEPSPSPSAEIYPSPSDSSTPAPTLEPSPSATLTPTPEATPTLEPSSAPTTEPEVSTTPAPTPNESPNPPPALPSLEPSVTITPSPAPESSEQGSLSAVVLENTSAESVTSLDLDPVDVTSASLTTDKTDYAPTDTAVISGTNLTPNTTYIIIVSSTDDPAVTHSENVTTDGSGQFVYAYQLDGNYRPNYSVELKDQSGNTVATTTFTDAQASIDLEQCHNLDGSVVNCTDLSGPTNYWGSGNAQLGNAQLSEGDNQNFRAIMSNITNGTYTLVIQLDLTKGGKVAYDRFSSTGKIKTILSPLGNTPSRGPVGGGDNPEDLGVFPCVKNGADTYCVPGTLAYTATIPAITGLPAGSFATDVTNSQSAANVQEMEVYGSGTVTLGSYTFSGDVNGDSSLSLSMSVTKTGGTGDLVLAWGGHVSKASDYVTSGKLTATSINGSPYHMRLVSFSALQGDPGNQDMQMASTAIIQTGHLIVQKTTLPAGDTTSFTINATSSTGGTITGGGAGTVTDATDKDYEVTAGTYSVAETVPAGWTKTGDSCQNVVIAAGETKTCLLTNTKKAHVIIVKNAIPNNAQDFHFTDNFGNGNPASFDLDDDGNIANDLPKQRDSEVLPGTYSVSEGTVAGWQSPESTSCTDGSPVNAIVVSPGETVTCTFVNEKLAKIILVKNTIGGNDSFDFDATGAGLPTDIDLTTVAGTASQTFENLDPDNTYTISENVPAGWALTNAVCSGTNTPASITPNAGEVITCTFTDNKPAAQIDLTPLQANNKVGQDHVVSATVQVHNGNGTWGPAANGTTVTFSITNSNGATATFNGGVNTCTTTSGTCSVTIKSPTTGHVVVNASASPVVLGVTLPVATGTGGDNSVDAQKDYVNARISIAQDDTNEVDDPHTFTVTVEEDTGSGFGGVEGVNPTVTFTPGDPGTVIDNCSTSGTNSNGQCTVVINSAVAGIFTVTASANISVNTVPFSLTTNGLNGNSESAEKTYVDASINLTPQEATNSVKETHIITAHVTKNDGSGVSDAEGVTVVFSITGGAEFVGGDNDCVTDGVGVCSISIVDDAPGDNTINATTTFSVGGVSLTRSTNGDAGPDGSDAAEKTYVAGKIVVIKQTFPDGSQQSFEFHPSYSNNFPLTDGQQNESDFLAPGTYSVDELTPAGWDETNVSCSDQSDPGSISLQAGETVTCTFTNTQHGHLIVEKTTLPAGDKTEFPIEALGIGGSVIGDTTGVITDTTDKDYEVTPGIYVVNESVPNDWDQTGTTCQGVQVGPGETVHCTITNAKRVHLTINKVIIPPPFLEKDPGKFRIFVDGGFVAANIDPITDQQTQVFGVPPSTDVDGTTGEKEVNAGTHTISEQGVDGTDVSKYGGEIICEGNGFTASPQTQPGVRDVTLENGANVVCTITNRFVRGLGLGFLTVVKNTSGGDDTFNYSISSTVPGTIIPDNSFVAPFSITTFSGTGTDASNVIFAAPGFPAHVTLGENSLPSGWDFTGLNCTSDGGKGSTFDYSGTTVKILFQDEDSVTCTYTNTKRGSITIVKDAQPNDTADFNFSGSLGNFTLDDDAGVPEGGDSATPNNLLFGNLLPGLYSVSETQPNAFWTLGNISCIDTDTQTPYGVLVSGNGMTLDLAPGKHVQCTFVNNKESPTRTLGFWQTHTAYTSSIFAAAPISSNMPIGTAPHKGFITNTGQLFGAFYADISKLSNSKTPRTPLDKARIQLLQQLVAAKLNCAAFGCAASVQSLIATADSHYATGTAAQMLTDAGLLDAYNNSGDTIIFGSVGKATPKTSQALANKVFWDTP